MGFSTTSVEKFSLQDECYTVRHRNIPFYLASHDTKFHANAVLLLIASARELLKDTTYIYTL